MADLLPPRQTLRRAWEHDSLRVHGASMDPGLSKRWGAARLQSAGRAYTTRCVPSSSLFGLMPIAGLRPLCGDLLLAVVTAVERPARLVHADGACVPLCSGHEIVVAFEAPDDSDDTHAVWIDRRGVCRLVAEVGVVGMEPRGGTSVGATVIQPVGLVTDRRGLVVNLLHHAAPESGPVEFEPRVDSLFSDTGPSDLDEAWPCFKLNLARWTAAD